MSLFEQCVFSQLNHSKQQGLHMKQSLLYEVKSKLAIGVLVVQCRTLGMNSWWNCWLSSAHLFLIVQKPVLTSPPTAGSTSCRPFIDYLKTKLCKPYFILIFKTFLCVLDISNLEI